MNKVKVYYFTTYNVMTDETRRMQRPATREAIAAAHGTVLEETVQEVDASLLDGNDFLSPNKK